MRNNYSYKTKTEDKRLIRRTILYFTLTIASMAILFFFGIPVIAKFATLLSDLNKSNKVTEINDKIPPPPPHLNTIPEATNTSNIDIGGTSEPGASVYLVINNKENEIVASSNGEFLLNIKLSDGENTITAYAVDQSGNKSQKTNTYKVVFDNKNPDIEISKPKDQETFYGQKSQQITIEGKTEANASLTINDRFVFVEDDGTFSYTTTLSEGDNNFDVKARDLAGNESEKNFKVSYYP